MDIARIFDAIDAAFGKHRQTCDYSLSLGDSVTVGEITYIVHPFDFVDPAFTTAHELAACLLAAGADVAVVPHDYDSARMRLEPRPTIRRVSDHNQENGRQP
jgi:hypothetical protein